MSSATKALEQAQFVTPFDRGSSTADFWNVWERERPQKKAKFGARWAVHYVMYLESLGKDIEIEDKNIGAEYLMINNLLVQQFASGSLGKDGDRAAEAKFQEPRVQALLRDAPPV